MSIDRGVTQPPEPRVPEPAPPSSTGTLLPFLAELLAEQQTLLTPVARFSWQHDHPSDAGPAMAPVYRDLIPLSQPGPGEQYAFEVDLDSCSGCKSCVSACHSLNGLDDNESWRDVGHIVGGDDVYPFQQTITSACHHCADPGCLNGCPVLAYEKDPITGIVRHLDDQCIGCSYCVLKCPYDVPKFSARLGIVRKCDMCHGRLAEGEAPACVQACPTHAIKIVTVAVDLTGPKPKVDTSHFLPGAPDAATTQPTTRYVSQKPLPANVRAVDASRPKPQPAHWPLVILLCATQIGYGLSLARFASSIGPPSTVGWVAVAFAAIGLAASVAHLGRPTRAWRIFLGLRRSWLSREAVLFGAWFPLLVASIWQPTWLPGVALLPAIAAFVGGAAVACSAMIYIDTPRRFWRAPATAIRMGGTVATAAILPISPAIAAVIVLGKLVFESRQTHSQTPSGHLLRTVLRPSALLRILLALTGFCALVTYYVTSGPVAFGAFWVAAGALAGSELTERLLYFRAVDPSKMPGIAAS